MSWPVVSLGSVATFLSGFAFKSEKFNSDGRGLPIVRIRDVVRGQSNTFFDGDFDPRYLVEDGDYLIGMDGEFNLAPWRGGQALLNQRVCKLDTLRSDVDRAYVAKFLPMALKRIEDSTPFVTVKHLSVKKLNEVALPLPPLEEQRRIAAILDQAETLRAQRRAAIALLDQLPQAIFLEMFGDFDSVKGRWPVIQFHELVQDTKLGLVRSAQEFGPAFSVPYVRMNAITRSGDLELTSVQRTEVTDRELEEFQLKEGDFLFNTRNSAELVGKTALFRGGGQFVFNNNILRVRFNERVHPEFVAAAFRTRLVQRELGLRKSGTTNVFAIYYKELRTIPIPTPPLDLQRQFVKTVEAIHRAKAAHQSALAELDALSSALQSTAFTGEF